MLLDRKISQNDLDPLPPTRAAAQVPAGRGGRIAAIKLSLILESGPAALMDGFDTIPAALACHSAEPGQ